MTDRTVKVSLTAQVSGYIAGMKQAAAYTTYATDAAEKLAAKKEALRGLSVALLAIGAVAAAGVGLAIKEFAAFDAKMSTIKTLAHATAEEMDALTKAALTMGQSIGFSAVQTADAQMELVKAGLSVSQIMSGALKGALQLAAAGQIEVGDATEIATIALTQFGLAGKDIPHVADLLSAGADKALGGVSDLGEALKSGGLVAAQFGISIEDTVGTLSAFANAGLLGERAGTTLRQMFLKLGDPSSQAADVMKKLGLSIYDASGKFIGMSELAGQLHDKMGGLDEATRNAAFSTIFGSRAISGANVLYKEGAKGIGDWVDKVDSSGFAAHQAAGKMDNLEGDVKKLGAAFQTDLIQSGSEANNVLRGTVQTVTNLVKLFADLPAPVQGTVMAVGAAVAVVGLVGGAFLTAVPKIVAFKTSLDATSLSMKGLATAGGAVSIAVTALVMVLASIANAQADAKSKADEFTASLDQNTGALTDNTRAVAVKQLTDSGAIKLAKELGVSLRTVTDAALGNTGAQKELDRALDSSNLSTGRFGDQLHNAGSKSSIMAGKQSDLRSKVLGTSDALKTGVQNAKDAAAAMGEGATKTETAASAYGDAASKAKALSDAVAQLTDQINTANGVGQDAVTSNASYQKALADSTTAVAKYVKEHGKSAKALDENTAAGATNASMLAGLAKSSEDAAKAQLTLDGNTGDYQKRLQAGRQAVIDRAIALGATADQAQALADKIAAIPSQKDIQILADTTSATRVLDKFIADIASRRPVLHIDGQVVRSGDVQKHASGGTVTGTGGPKSDSNLAFLSRGEEVIQEPYASRFRPQLKAMNQGQIPGFAGGGTFTPAPTYVSAPQQGFGGGGGATITMPIYPSVGMSEETIGRVAANELNFALRGN